ncbi:MULTISPECIES: class I SAM-dependent methyltransferase [Chelativorans]|jgi:phospholipid N-methyltransferase|uniref:Putative phospholipid N-methyltransferase n=1 Tax=Chelativorans sp. (strain BNC1) TaxID=266779 RepID=Q11BF2_CHESB|nr:MULTISPECIES: putative phospholipid N-methyltransferase [Chelativorans]
MAIAPSSAAPADLITSEISAANAPVLELGPGTGVFTHRLIERGITESQLILVESGDAFAYRLSRTFPKTTVLRMDAGRLRIAAPVKAGAVISGLPLLSMPPSTVMRIMRGAFANLRDAAAFYQFTYGYRCPVPPAILARLALRATSLRRVFSNPPPASVYRIEHIAHAR